MKLTQTFLYVWVNRDKQIVFNQQWQVDILLDLMAEVGEILVKQGVDTLFTNLTARYT